MQPRNSRTTNTRSKALATMTDVLQGARRIEAVLSIIQKRSCVSLLRGEQNAREKQRLQKTWSSTNVYSHLMVHEAGAGLPR
jgi:hypothetical protein